MSLSIKVAASIVATITKDFAFSLEGSIPIPLSESFTLEDGTSDDQADLVYHTAGTIAGGGSNDVDLDLVGSVSDVYGDSADFAGGVKVIMVLNTSDEQDPATTAIIHVGGGSDGAGTAAFDTWITSTAADGSEALILPDGAFALIVSRNDPYACSAGSDILRILNTHATATAAYSVLVGGVSS